MKRQEIRLATDPLNNNGKTESLVNGYTEGNLAIHKRLESTDKTMDPWTITHIPSGFCLGHRLGFLIKAKERVRNLLLVDDWFIKNAKFGDISKVTKKRLKELENVVNVFRWS